MAGAEQRLQMDVHANHAHSLARPADRPTPPVATDFEDWTSREFRHFAQWIVTAKPNAMKKISAGRHNHSVQKFVDLPIGDRARG